MEDEPIIVNRAINLTASNGAGFVEVYSPGVGRNGYVFDFVMTVQISSIPQLPVLTPGDAFETTAQRDHRYYELVNDYAAKYLGLYISLPGSTERILRSRVKIWNSWPPYQQDLMREVTAIENLALSPGSKLWVRVEEVSSSSALSGGDSVSLWLAAGELPVEGSPAITAGIPYGAVVSASSSVILPANPNRKLVTIVNRGQAIAYMNLGSTAVANAGIALNPGGSSYVLNVREINYKGAIAAIVASGSATLEIMEAV